MKTLLIISGGLEALEGIRCAKEMGLRVVVSDGDQEAPGFALADESLVCSTYDIEGTIRAAREFHQINGPIDGVICIAADVPLTVASVAAELGLPGIPVEAARLSMDKLAMKRKFAADNLPVPWFSEVKSLAELEEISRVHDLPLVLKPVDSRGARGVIRLTEDVDLNWAFNTSMQESPSGMVMVEKFLSGPQVSTESIVLNGIAHTPGVADRNYELLEHYAPFMIENGGQLPSHLPQTTQEAIKVLIEQSARSMGIIDGVVKGDIVVHEGKPYIIEMATRLSGGYLCTYEIPLNTGVNFVKQAILLALGEKIDPLDLKPKYQRHVVQRYLFPNPGRVVHVAGADSVARRPDISYCEVRVKPNDVVRPVESHPARAGVVMATGETQEAALSAATAAVEEILIKTIPI